MADAAENSKQRLRTLENQIRKNYEAFVQTGFALKEIRDDELYKEDGFESWERYLKERVGDDFKIERRQAFNLIACAQIRAKLPDSCSTLHEDGWAQRELLELGRLAPKSEEHGQKYDFDKLNKRDVERVTKKVIDHCEREETKPTSTIVRKFVDEELGIDRAAQAKETKRQREEQAHPMLDRWLMQPKTASSVCGRWRPASWPYQVPGNISTIGMRGRASPPTPAHGSAPIGLQSMLMKSLNHGSFLTSFSFSVFRLIFSRLCAMRSKNADSILA